MGTRMGLSYACLFVGFMKRSLFNNYTGTIRHLFLRYIDDCIGAASCSRKELKQFINFAKNLSLDPQIHLDRPKQPFQIQQRFTCTSSNLIYCICCSQCGCLYSGETKRRLGDQFMDHLCSARTNQPDLPVAIHFNSPSHSPSDIVPVLYKAVSEPPLGLTDVEEATSGAADGIDYVDGCAAESLSNVESLFGALNGGEGGGVGA
eukprot:g39716.t1